LGGESDWRTEAINVRLAERQKKVCGFVGSPGLFLVAQGFRLKVADARKAERGFPGYSPATFPEMEVVMRCLLRVLGRVDGF